MTTQDSPVTDLRWRLNVICSLARTRFNSHSPETYWQWHQSLEAFTDEELLAYAAQLREAIALLKDVWRDLRYEPDARRSRARDRKKAHT